MNSLRLSRVGRRVGGLLLVLVLLILILAGAGRLLTPMIGEFRDDLDAYLETVLDAEVELGELQARWWGISPHFQISSLSVRRADGVTLQAEELRFGPDLAASLWRFEPVLAYLDLGALQLSLPYQDAVDAGEASSRRLPALSALVAALQRAKQLRVRQADLTLQTPVGEPLVLQQVTLGWDAGLLGQQLQVSLELPSGAGTERAELKALFSGEPGSMHFRSRFYLQLPMVDEQLWQPWLAARYPELLRLSVGGEFWGDWRGEQLHQLTGKVQLPMFSWQFERGVLDLETASVDFRVQHRLGGWQMQLEGLQGVLDDEALPWPRVTARWDENRLEFAGDRIDLQALNQWQAKADWLPERLQQELDVLQPEGNLRRLHLLLPKEDPRQFRLRADLDRVGVAAWKGAPELRGVDGLLQVEIDGGRVDFETDEFSMHFPRLYDQGWHYQQASGVVHWRLSPEATLVESERLQLRGQVVEANGRFRLWAPADHASAPKLSLLIGMQNTDGTLAPSYVPDQFVSKDLKRWLAGAIRRGDLKQGLFLYHGPAGEDIEPVTTQMYFDVAEGEVAYQPDWPSVRDAEVETLIKGNDTLVAVRRGRIYGSQISQAEVRVPPGSPTTLLINASLAGDAGDIRRVLLESPLSRYTGELSAWQLSGSASSSFSLRVPLDGSDPRVSVVSNLRQGRFASKALDLVFDRIAGQVRYTDSGGLSANSLSGRLFGEAVTARIVGNPDSRVHTRVLLDGRADMREVHRRWPMALLKMAQGVADYHAELDLCGQPNCSELRVESALQGVTLDLPTPYGKGADSKRDLQVRVGLGAPEQPISVALGKQFSLALALRADEFYGGELNFGGVARQQRLPGLLISGALPAADLNAWQAWLRRLNPSAGEGGEVAVDPALREAKLTIGEVTWGDESLRDLQLRLYRPQGRWLLALQNEALGGYLQLPDSAGQPWEARFDYIHLGKPVTAETELATIIDESDQDPLAAFDPAEFPLLNFSTQAFTYRGEDYGAWRFNTRRISGGVRLENIEGEIRRLAVTGGLDWTRSDAGHRTYAFARAKGQDLGDVLVAWDSPRALESKRLQIEGELGWQGSPAAFKPELLDGDLTLNVEDGRFLDISTAGNTLRLFGLMNLNTIGRRLRLDFSDLLKEGVSFDRINGHYLFNLGVGVSDGPLKISGPSASFELEGTLDLSDKTLNQTLTLILPVSDNLPVAAVLLGAPQVAGAVFLIEKLVGKHLARFSSARYSIYGDWSDPQIELLNPPENARTPKRNGN